MHNAERIILGIDPGTTVTGFGIIRCSKSGIVLLDLQALSLSKKNSHALKLKDIFEHTLGLIDKYHPDELSIEAPFFGKNVQSMLKLGRAQGVAMAAGLFRQVPIFEYSPKKIKQSITGNGNASKEQVAAMLQNILQLKELPNKLDATDALASAVCHYYQAKFSSGKTKNPATWAGFLKNFPEKIIR